jgi:ribosome-binding protein aMBF1 (putative translation factor)
MSLTIYVSKKCKPTTAKKSDDSNVEDDFANEPNANKGDDQSDSEESDKKDDDSSITVNDFQGELFDIGQTIDLKSKDLADVLTEKDLLPRKAIIKKTQPCVAASEKVLSKEDWEM